MAWSARNSTIDFTTEFTRLFQAAGYLCERAYMSSFTGDVLSWVKERIDSAVLLVADLSGANPNVYLEVGYA